MIISSLFSILAVALVSLIGIIFVFFAKEKIRTWSSVFVSLAIGTLFADALLHILPEANEKLGAETAGLLVLTGIIFFLIFERVFHWQHEHDPECPKEHPCRDNKPLGYMNLLADGVHNMIDGILIGSSYLVSVPLGVATTIAVLLHEIPQEIGDFSILLHAGFSEKKALFFNFLSACMAFLGLFLALFLQTLAPQFANWMLPITAGGFIYIAGSDLIPHLHKHNDSPKRFLLGLGALLAGVLIMAAFLFFE